MISKIRFPFYVFAAAFLVYAVTLSRGITLDTLALTSQLAGWDWQPMSSRPVLWLVTLPLRILPAGWMAVGINLFSAFCGALTLGLLARSVDLLPWKRAAGAGRGWAAKVPVLLACAVCGLEFNFWREATAATGDMMDVLLFAATLWCLLEFHKSRGSRWLDLAALIWGLTIANNCFMALFLPLFVIVLIWLKRLDFLNGPFLIRTALFFLAGISAYALLPLANGLNPWSPWSFFHAWYMSLMSSRHMLGNLKAYFWVAHRLVGLMVAVYFIIAGLPFLVRFENSATKFKSSAQTFQIWAHRTLRAVLLLIFLWLAFDPVPGPRQLVRKQTGLYLSLLAFDYLMALSIGFIVGDFLVTALRDSRRERQPSQNSRGAAATGRSVNIPAMGFAGLAGLTALGLILRNAPPVYAANRNSLESFGNLAVKSLPPGGGIVLSDEPDRLLVFQAALSHQSEGRQWLPVNTRALPQADYRAVLERQDPRGWLATNSARELRPLELLDLLDKQLAGRRTFYLNDSFGYFFERYYLVPSGFIYEMKARPKNGANPPPLASENIDAGENFWTDAWQRQMTPMILAREKADHPSPLARATQGYLQKLGLAPQLAQAEWLPALWGSAALNAWGVELQRLGHFALARQRFEQARTLRTNNLVALFNLECNTNLQSGLKMGLEEAPLAAKWLGDDDREIGLVLQRCGPFDQPVFCYLLGCIYQKSGLSHQAVDELERAAVLAPDSLAPQVMLAQAYSSLRLDARVFELVRHLHPLVKNLPATNTLDVQLSVLEAGSWMSQTNPARAREILQKAVAEHPHDPAALDLVARAFVAFGDYPNALQLVKQQVAADPDDASSLVKMSSILMLMNQSPEALPLLDRAISISPSSIAYLSRATAFLQCTNYAAAAADFLEAESKDAEPYLVHYGLAEIALRQKDTNTAIRQFAICLTNSPEGTPRWKDTYSRLKAIKLAMEGTGKKDAKN